MRIGHLAKELAPAAELVGDLVRDVARLLALEPPKTRIEARVLVDPDDDGRALALAEREVLRSAARRDVHDAGALGLAHLIPLDDLVERCGLRSLPL